MRIHHDAIVSSLDNTGRTLEPFCGIWTSWTAIFNDWLDDSPEDLISLTHKTHKHAWSFRSLAVALMIHAWHAARYT